MRTSEARHFLCYRAIELRDVSEAKKDIYIMLQRRQRL